MHTEVNAMSNDALKRKYPGGQVFVALLSYHQYMIRHHPEVIGDECVPQSTSLLLVLR